MASFEADKIGYQRAKFNRPFKNIEMIEGSTHTKLSSFLDRANEDKTPLINWLDYDDGLSVEALDDLRKLVAKSPTSSIILVTINAQVSRLGNDPKERPEAVNKLFDEILSEPVTKPMCTTSAYPETLIKLLRDFAKSAFHKSGRDGKFLDAFQLVYEDTCPMVTVGYILADETKARAIEKTIKSRAWTGKIPLKIQAPHLTIKEINCIQSNLPRRTKLTRKSIKRMGFDLKDKQIKIFEEFYKYYPSYAEINS
jgi:hypothetical protein